jgi:prophage regulatory protein
MNSTDNKSSLRVIRWPEVHDKIGISRSQVHLLIARGKFPPPIKLGLRACGWLEGEIDDWLGDRISNSRSVRPNFE